MDLEHVVGVSQFTRPIIEQLFASADQMRAGDDVSGALRGRILATLFYEPSTRTRLSFESAMLRLGGQVIATENAREFSSAIKGETVEDTIRIVAGYADAIVIRHYQQGAAERAAAVATVPIINAGDGPGEHPTQALLDLYTIQTELGRIDKLKVALVGDLRYGRAARSLALMLGLTEETELIFVAPEAVAMGNDVRTALQARGVSFRDEPSLGAALGEADVVYQTRIQRERFATLSEYDAVRDVYILDESSLRLLRSDAVILHPLPRVNEITASVDSDPRAAYFRQAHNGVFLRMALLNALIRH